MIYTAVVLFYVYKNINMADLIIFIYSSLTKINRF